MAGLIDLVGSGEIGKDSTVLYAHLSGQPALSAYGAPALLGPLTHDKRALLSAKTAPTTQICVYHADAATPGRPAQIGGTARPAGSNSGHRARSRAFGHRL